MKGLRIGVIIGAVLLAFAGSAAAQDTATLKDKLGWNQALVTPAQAATFVYRAYIDALPGVPVTGVVCIVAPGSTTDAACSCDFPAATPGVVHTITLTAGEGTIESPKSNILSFRFTLVQTPQGLQIIRVP